MADINLNFGAEDLEKFKVLLDEIKKQVDAIKKAVSTTGNVVEDDISKTKRLAVERKKIENAMKKEELAAGRLASQQERVNQKTREAGGILGRLEQQAKEFRSAMKSANTEAEMKKAQAGLKRVQAEITKAKGATAGWGKALGSFQFKFNALGNIAANVVSKMTTAMTQFAKESIKAAAEADGITRAFKKLNDPALLGKLREAVQGTVSDVALMTAAIKANNFQIPLQNLPKFFAFAAQRADETGEEVDYLVESIVNGIARRSLPILDNLGFSATELRNEMAKTGDMALAVGNIIERSMGDANKPLLSTGQLYAQARANAENMKVQFGEVANLFLIKILPAANKFVTFLREALMTQEMIERQVLDGLIIQQIEQDRLEVQELAVRLEEKRIKLKEGQTYEERAALLLLQQYSVLLANTAETDVKRIESLAAQIKALEIIAGIAPKPGSVLDPTSTFEDVSKLLENLKDEGEFTEEDQAAFYWGSEFWDAIIATSKEKMAEMSELLEKQRAEEFAKADVDRKKTADAIAAAEDLKQKKIQESFDLANRLTNTFSDIFAAAKAKELSMVGDNAEKREAIEKKYAKREQIMAIAQAVIDGALALQKIQGSIPPPANIPFLIASGALTATQVGVIASQKFAKGDIDIKGPSHARGGISAEIEGGESVINKRSTSKYKDLLRAINEDDQMRIMDAMGRDRKINVNGSGDPYNRKIYELMSSQHNYGEDSQFYYKQVGNTLYKQRK